MCNFLRTCNIARFDLFNKPRCIEYYTKIDHLLGVPVDHVVGTIDVQGDARSSAVREALTWRQPDQKDVGPCGGFSSQYASVCDFFQVTFREEVAWDVDTIYFSHDSHEMCLQDFDHLEHRDLVCIVSALEHNTW